MTNSSYRTVACKVVQRSLGKSPAKSFVQELSLWKKISQTQYRGINYSKKKTIVLFPSSNTIETIIIIIIIIIII